jgi:exodeoxyribonuclease VII small subunit
LAKKRSKTQSAQPPSFEQAVEELERIVRQLEEGQIGLDEALGQYERGVGLLRQCYDLLKRAERQIELLSGVDADGVPITTPVDEPSREPEQDAPKRRPPGSEPPDTTKKGGGRPPRSDIDSPKGLF